MHPNFADAYRRKVEELERLLGDPELGPEAMEVIRSMITRIEISPKLDGKGVHLDLSGDLAQILSICSGVKQQNARAVAGAGRFGDFDYEVSVVAGAGFEPATFRL